MVNLRQTKEMFRQLKQIAVDLQHKLDTLPVAASSPSAAPVVVEEKKEEEPVIAAVPASRGGVTAGGRAPAKARTSAAKQASVAVTRTVDLTSAPSPTNATTSAAAPPTVGAAAQPVVIPVSRNGAAATTATPPAPSPTNASASTASAPVGTIVNGVNILTASGLIATPPPAANDIKEATPLPPPREADAFEDYKRTDGQTLATAFDTNRGTYVRPLHHHIFLSPI